MANDKFGMVDWGATKDKKFDKSTNVKDSYMTLVEGSNILRVITKPYQYKAHLFVKRFVGDAGKKFTACIDQSQDSLTKLGSVPKDRWYIGVIDRKTGMYKLLDAPWSIYNGISELAKSEKWGPCEQYDIDIKKNKGGNPTYLVLPDPKTPLSAADLEIQSSVDREALLKKCTPITAEELDKWIINTWKEMPTELYIQKEEDKEEKKASKTTAKATAKAPAPAPASTADDDTDFPSADGSD